MYIRGALALLGVSPFDGSTQQDTAILASRQQDGNVVMPFLLLATAANAARVLTLLRSAFRSGSSLRELDLQELAIATAPSLLLFAQSCVWACYGHYAREPNIAWFNALLAGMCVAFFGCAARTTRLRNIQWLSALCAGVITASLLAIAWVPSCATDACRVLVSSSVGSIVTASLFAASLHKAVEVVRTESFEKFSVVATAAAFLSTALWARYSWTTGNAVYFRLNAAGCAVAVAEMVLCLSVFLRAVGRRAPNRKGPACLAPKEPLPKAPKTPKKAPAHEGHRPMMPRGHSKANISYCDAWLGVVGEQQFANAWCEISARELAAARTEREDEQRKSGAGKKSVFGSSKRSSPKPRCEQPPAANPAQALSQGSAAAADPGDAVPTRAQRLYVRQPMEKHVNRRPAREGKQAVRINNVTCAVDCIL